MASSTINITLPEPLKACVEAQAESGDYGTPSDYVRELILDDRDRQLARLEDRLLDNLKVNQSMSSVSLGHPVSDVAIRR